jgi:hypothetical protein
MYQITEKEQEHGGKWRVRVIASPSESMFLWFDVEPTQDAVDAAVDKQLQQQALQNPVVETVILKCSAWQMRKALNAAGMRDAIEYAVANSGDQAVQDGWEYATEFNRYDPFVVQFGVAMGKTEAEMDALFQLGMSL